MIKSVRETNRLVNTYLLMSMSIASDMLVVLGNALILFIAQLAVKRAKSRNNFGLDGNLLRHFVLKRVVSPYYSQIIN